MNKHLTVFFYFSESSNEKRQWIFPPLLYIAALLAGLGLPLLWKSLPLPIIPHPWKCCSRFGNRRLSHSLNLRSLVRSLRCCISSGEIRLINPMRRLQVTPQTSSSEIVLKNQGRDSIHLKNVTKNITKNVTKNLSKSYNKKLKKSVVDTYILFRLDFREAAVNLI